MISMKALEVSENFLMSTGLGTLRGENRERQNSRGASESIWYSLSPGLKEEGGQREAALDQSQQMSTSQDGSPFLTLGSASSPWHLSSLLPSPSPLSILCATTRWVLIN